MIGGEQWLYPDNQCLRTVEGLIGLYHENVEKMDLLGVNQVKLTVKSKAVVILMIE